MPESYLSDAVWRKSTRSSALGQCVEVAMLHGATAIRDSKHPTGPALIFTPSEWAAFVGGVQDRQFTHS